MSPTQPKPGPTRRGGRNLGLRFQQLEYSLRSTTREAALLADSSRLVEGQDPVLAHNKSRVPRERVEIFHGLVVPKEPTPPEPDGQFFFLFRLEFDADDGSCFRMLHVRVFDLRLRSLRGFSLDIQNVGRFASNGIEIHGNPGVGVAFTHKVFAEFSGHQQTVQHQP